MSELDAHAAFMLMNGSVLGSFVGPTVAFSLSKRHSEALIPNKTMQYSAKLVVTSPSLAFYWVVARARSISGLTAAKISTDYRFWFGKR